MTMKYNVISIHKFLISHLFYNLYSIQKRFRNFYFLLLLFFFISLSLSYVNFFFDISFLRFALYFLLLKFYYFFVFVVLFFCYSISKIIKNNINNL